MQTRFNFMPTSILTSDRSEVVRSSRRGMVEEYEGNLGAKAGGFRSTFSEDPPLGLGREGHDWLQFYQSVRT